MAADPVRVVPVRLEFELEIPLMGSEALPPPTDDPDTPTTLWLERLWEALLVLAGFFSRRRAPQIHGSVVRIFVRSGLATCSEVRFGEIGDGFGGLHNTRPLQPENGEKDHPVDGWWVMGVQLMAFTQPGYNFDGTFLGGESVASRPAQTIHFYATDFTDWGTLLQEIQQVLGHLQGDSHPHLTGGKFLDIRESR